MRLVALLLLLLAVLGQGFARLEKSICGTYRDRWREEVHLHRGEKAKRGVTRLAANSVGAARDIGEIAILEDSDGVVARRNEFNLDKRTLRFSPVDAGATQYRFALGDASYDGAAASAGSPLSLGDDDAIRVPLPFTFPFFGAAYSQIFVNSDGNLTFLGNDVAVTDRSLGRVVAGPPRLAALFLDLDPTRRPDGVRVLAETSRFTVSWDAVPEYGDFGFGSGRTFQIRLFPDGRIEFAYNGVPSVAAVVGISPGGTLGTPAVVSFAAGSAVEYSSTIAERFGSVEELDIVTAAQQFYRTHEDAYDYLVFYNNLGLGACAGSVACEVTVRNHRTGYGDPVFDSGDEFGSASRLQAVLNMGPLSQYPRDPNGIVPGRQSIGDTPISVIAHETGHLFLAYASVRDTADPIGRPMLGFQNAHWAFTFNSEASLLEGNRILDKGAGAAPRFETTGAVQGFSPVDQYLMGLRPPEEVGPTFLVAGTTRAFATRSPLTGVRFDGQRRDVSVEEIVASEGRRTPDSTVSQRRFRFAFVLIVRQGSTPAQSDIDQIDTYRREFESYFRRAASDRASADASLKMSLRLSIFPAAGVIAGRSMAASVSIQKPAVLPVTIALRTLNGAGRVDPSVTIPAGATSATFTVTGMRGGVDEILAEANDPRYDQATARIQVLSGPDAGQLTLSTGDGAAVTMRISDGNNLPYPGVPVVASAIGGGAVTPAVAISDPQGQVSFNWTPGVGASPVLTARIEGSTGPPVFVTPVSAGARFSFTAPVNAASGAPGLSPGSIASIYGSNLSRSAGVVAPLPWPDTLAGVRVLLDGKPAPVLFVSGSQVNFLVPLDQNVGALRVTLVTPDGSADVPSPAPLERVSPGIFYDAATGFGAILNPGTVRTTKDYPAARGDYVEIYATGLGPTGAATVTPEVTIGGAPASVSYSGLAPGYLGLYQVNVQIPAGIGPGEHPLQIFSDAAKSNIVKIGIR